MEICMPLEREITGMILPFLLSHAFRCGLPAVRTTVTTATTWDGQVFVKDITIRYAF